MTDAVMENFSFGHGFVQGRGKVRVIATLDDLTEQGSAASMLMMWAGEQRGWRHFDLGWTAIRIICSEAAMFALGADGRVMVADASGVRQELIDGVDERGELRDLCLVGTELYAVGAAGQAYRREGPGAWVAAADGLADADLRAVDGTGAGGLTAVGGKGQIWRREAGGWRRLDSPTDRSLDTLIAIDESLTYAAGAGGVLLRGDGDQFVSAVYEPAPEDLTSVAEFAGRVFAAGATGLYALRSGGRLERVEVLAGPGWTFGHLHAAADVMWSFGSKHLLWTADGESWTLVRSPFQSIDPVESGAASASCSCEDDSHHHHD
jgi:hypothetical protein